MLWGHYQDVKKEHHDSAQAYQHVEERFGQVKTECETLPHNGTVEATESGAQPSDHSDLDWIMEGLNKLEGMVDKMEAKTYFGKYKFLW